VNALLELVIVEICRDESPELVTETLVEAVVPIFTSPKSTVDGDMATDAELDDGDEKALESDPQPDRPKVKEIEISASTPQRTRRCERFRREVFEETANISLASKNEKRRILFMRCHLIQSQSGVSVSRCRKPR
jgi:hypothetical protein